MKERSANKTLTKYRKASILYLLLFFLSVAIPPFAAQFSAATPIIQTQIDPIFLVRQGQQLYDRGQFIEAVPIWQQAAEVFASQGNRLNQAMTLSNLSLTYQQLGNWEGATETIAQSLSILETLENNATRQRILAQTFDIQGQLQQTIGQSQAALSSWQKSANLYATLNDVERETNARINQAQAMQDLGLYVKACRTLLEGIGLDNSDCSLSSSEIEILKQDLIKSDPNSIQMTKARGLRSLGNVLRITSNLQQSQQVLLIGLEITQKWNLPQDEGKVLLNLGNIERALAMRSEELQETQEASSHREQALINYERAANLLTSNLKIQAQINQLELLIEDEKWQKAEELSLQIQVVLNSLKLSREKTYNQINLSKNIICLQENNSNCFQFQKRLSSSPPLEAIQLLEEAIQDSEKLQDKRTQSYATGFLGRIYEKTEEWKKAQQYTEQALLEAWQSQASDLIYQWQWQLGRLLEAQGKTQEALLATRQAVNTLQSLRKDLVSVNPEIQFTFRESVEPVYREYVSLLLKPQGDTPVSQENLGLAREAIDALQLAELENFFRLVCLDAKPVAIDRVTDQNDPTAAIIYPILLKDRWEIVLKLPHQPLRHYTTPISSSQEIEAILERLTQTLNQPNNRETLPLARQVYHWLLRPLEQDLAGSSVRTLVFVLDSALRNTPMTVLNDGQTYLIEKYNIAIAPSLQLLDPQPLERKKSKVLLAGVSEARENFPPLPFVPGELRQIQSQVPNSVELLDRSFTNVAFSKSLTSDPFRVVHLATHGQFSSQAENTFILTWDGRLNIARLNNLLRSKDSSQTEAIELLVLSACETLTGDRRAALGLAGIAVRAGARSTLATLWPINDRATAYLMEQFYASLKDPAITKAEALRRAQVALLNDTRFARPHYWAAYVLLGNWL